MIKTVLDGRPQILLVEERKTLVHVRLGTLHVVAVEVQKSNVEL